MAARAEGLGEPVEHRGRRARAELLACRGEQRPHGVALTARRLGDLARLRATRERALLHLAQLLARGEQRGDVLRIGSCARRFAVQTTTLGLRRLRTSAAASA